MDGWDRRGTKNMNIHTKTCSKCGGAGPFYRAKHHRDGLTSHCKSCRALVTKAWKQSEEYRAQQRAYQNARRTNPETRATVLSHKRAAQKAWKAAHPEEHNRRALVYTQRRRARLRGAMIVSITPMQWADTLEYFGNACAYCLRTGVALTQDHVTPVARGGDHSQDNIVPACRGCNARKSNRPVWTMAA